MSLDSDGNLGHATAFNCDNFVGSFLSAGGLLDIEFSFASTAEFYTRS